MKQSSYFLLQSNKYSWGTTNVFDVIALNSETGTVWLTLCWSCRNSAFWKSAQWLTYSWLAIFSCFSLPRQLWTHQKDTFFSVKMCGFHHSYCLAHFSDFCIVPVLRTWAWWAKGWPGLPATPKCLWQQLAATETGDSVWSLSRTRRVKLICNRFS